MNTSSFPPHRRGFHIGRRRPRMGSTLRRGARGASTPAAASLVCLGLTAPSVGWARSGAPSFSECEHIASDRALRAQIAQGARATLRAAAESIDYRELVEASWESVRFDLKFARIVDAQIAILRRDRMYLERLLDGNIPSRAEEMAKRTTGAVFDSPEFRALQEELQEDLGGRMEPLVAAADLQAHTRATECIRVFLGQRYASSVSEAFGTEARAARLQLEALESGAGTSAAFSLAAVLAGMLTVVFRRLVRRTVAAIVRRLAGALAARLAAWASVVLGAALLAYELVAGADGVFPLVREELTGHETKLLVQNALIDELSKVAPGQLDARADEIAGRLIDRWRRFQADHRAVLDLAERDAAFKRFVEAHPPEDFERLSAVVKAVKAAPPGGDEVVLDLLRRGLLARALALPSAGEAVETWMPRGVSLEDLIAWYDRTAERFEVALANRLPAHVEPHALSDAALDRLLSFQNPRTAARIAAMTERSRAELLELDTDQLLALTAQFDDRQLSRIFDALRPIASPTDRAAYLRTLQDEPFVLERLEMGSEAVAASRDPSHALRILLKGSHPLPPVADLAAVYEGRVAPMVLVHRYGWGLALTFGLPLLFVLWLAHWVGRLTGLLRRTP